MFHIKLKHTFTLLMLCSILSNILCFKYLIILHTASRSHYKFGFSLAKGLAAAGHDITLISHFLLEQPIPGITNIPIRPKQTHNNAAAVAAIKELYENAQQPILANFMNIHIYDFNITTNLFENAATKALLLQSNRTFDAVICEVFVNEAHFGFAEHFKAPLIGLGTFGAITWNTDMVGTPSPLSYVPHPFLIYNDHMSLRQRIINLAFITYERLIYEFYYLPKQQQIYRAYFPRNNQTIYEARRNAALVLVNQHFSISYARPYAPNMIEVGGMHIESKRKPLPAALEDFINGATHGVIYFAMGSTLRSTDLPHQKLLHILNTFRGIKQRVLWKFEAEIQPNKPKNVFISKWFPQQDILAHKKVLLFITHCGLLSIMETVYFGKPIIGVPLTGDEFSNMAFAAKNGYGIQVLYNELNKKSLSAAIARILSNATYTQKAQFLSAVFRDQQETPMERAIYWVEYISRHKGAQFMRSASQDLNFIEYQNLDAMFILYGGIIFILYTIISALQLIWFLLQLVVINSLARVQPNLFVLTFYSEY